MKPLDDEELSARLGALREGPWTARARHARRKLVLPGLRTVDLIRHARIDLDDLGIARSAAARAAERARELSGPLRWHELDPHGIKDPVDKRLRKSLDDALIWPQLVELAIETGYLPLDQVAQEARIYLATLLWSLPARGYVRTYNYLMIEFLASRLGIAGFTPHEPPLIDERAAVHFTAFLATEREIKHEPAIDDWLNFLDDYIVVKGGQQAFLRFLDGINCHDVTLSRRCRELLDGALSWAVKLGDFHSSLPEAAHQRFALFHAYWLAKLFGDDLGPKGYVRDTRRWGDGDACWARSLAGYFMRGASDDLSASGSVEARLMSGSLEQLGRSWQAARRFANEAANQQQYAMASTVTLGTPLSGD